METLDVVVGIVIYFLFMSLVASAVVEMISGYWRKRGRILRNAVDATTNGGDDFNNALYLHPLIYGLYESQKVGASERKSLPSYMPANVFAQAYVETVINTPLTEVGDLGAMFTPETRSWSDPREVPDLGGDGTDAKLVTHLGDRIDIQKGNLDDAYSALRPHVLAAGGDPQKTLERVAANFNRVNDRVKGRYRRWVGAWLFWIGLGLAAGTNGDATRVVSRLVDNDSLRNSIVENAEVLSSLQPSQQNGGDEGGAKEFAEAKTQLLQNIRVIEGISGGWGSDPIWETKDPAKKMISWALKVVGFIITAFAVSLGAPFWFDLLNKLLKIKTVVKSKDKDNKDEVSNVPKVESIDEVSTVLTAINAKMEPAALLLSDTQREHIRTMAQYAMASYDPPLEFKKAVTELKVDEEAAVELISQKSVIDAEGFDRSDNPKTDQIPVDTQAYVVRGKARIVVAFRGTETNLHDFATDARFQPTEVEWSENEEVLVHRGFEAALELVWKEIEKHLKKAGAQDLPVYFTGHSLGGALAVLAAARFASSNGSNKRDRFAGLHTFGQPRVGNPAFATWTENLFGTQYTRSVNHRDIVPQVPPPKFKLPEKPWWEYQHSGIAHIFDGSGRLAINPGWFFRLADYGLPDAELKTMLQQCLQNHAAHGYVALYEPAKNTAATTLGAVVPG